MWSKKHGLDACKRCGSSAYKHQGDGLCSSCYLKDYWAGPKRREQYRTYHREYARKMKVEQPEKYKARYKRTNRQTYRKNPEREKARVRYWQKENPGKVRAYKRTNDARRRGAQVGFHITAKERDCLLEHYNHQCLCCGDDADLTLDHIIPLSLGGEHTISNAQPLCRICNASKATKIIDYRYDVQWQDWT